MTAFADGDFVTSIEVFTRILQEDRYDISAFIMLALSYNKTCNFDYAIGVSLHAVQAYVELLESDPQVASQYHLEELDELLAESISLCAIALSDGGYNEPIAEQLKIGIDYYLANFQLHLSGIASIEAALAHKSQVLYKFTPRFTAL